MSTNSLFADTTALLLYGDERGSWEKADLVCWQGDNGLHDLRHVLLHNRLALGGDDSLSSDGLQNVIPLF